MTTSNVPDHIKANYQQFVDNGERTWEEIADQAKKDNAPALAAYARGRAAGRGDDVTPHAATTAPNETRGRYDEMVVKDLHDEAKRRGLDVKSNALRQQLVDALEEDDAKEPDVDQFKLENIDDDGTLVIKVAAGLAQKLVDEGFAEVVPNAIVEHVVADAGNGIEAHHATGTAPEAALNSSGDVLSSPDADDTASSPDETATAADAPPSEPAAGSKSKK